MTQCRRSSQKCKEVTHEESTRMGDPRSLDLIAATYASL
jgi:hypothetical protein